MLRRLFRFPASISNSNLVVTLLVVCFCSISASGVYAADGKLMSVSDKKDFGLAGTKFILLLVDYSGRENSLEFAEKILEFSRKEVSCGLRFFGDCIKLAVPLGIKNHNAILERFSEINCVRDEKKLLLQEAFHKAIDEDLHSKRSKSIVVAFASIAQIENDAIDSNLIDTVSGFKTKIFVVLPRSTKPSSLLDSITKVSGGHYIEDNFSTDFVDQLQKATPPPPVSEGPLFEMDPTFWTRT